jgi:hypothetical protein
MCSFQTFFFGSLGSADRGAERCVAEASAAGGESADWGGGQQQ